MRHLTLLAFFLVFELVVLFISRSEIRPDPLMFLALAFASSLAGRSIAYMTIFEWARAPFTKVVPHSSGAGESVEPSEKHPVLNVIGSWMSCPLCAGTWAGCILLAIYAYEPQVGSAMVYVLGSAGLGMLITRIIEAVEWQGRLAWEKTGEANRINRMFHNSPGEIRELEPMRPNEVFDR